MERMGTTQIIMYRKNLWSHFVPQCLGLNFDLIRAFEATSKIMMGRHIVIMIMFLKTFGRILRFDNAEILMVQLGHGLRKKRLDFAYLKSNGKLA